MIEIVTPDIYAHYRRELRDMHRLRCRVFRDRLGWDVETVNGEERDRFDDLGPVYILAFDDRRTVVGSWRLVPTTGPYMLRDVFPQLLEGMPPPADPLIWECSRFSVDCGEGRSDCLASVNRVTSEIFCGLIEYCLARGIREVITVYDIRIARILPRIGCHPSWQTKPQRIGKTKTLTGRFDITQEVLENVRVAGAITGSVVANAAVLGGLKAA